jgi:hypothetical protein
LPGNFFDYIPSNIISANNGFLHVIDKEWTINEKLEVGYLTFRSLYSLCFSIRKFGRPKKKIVKNFHDLIIYLMKGIYWSISDDKIKSWMTIETKIQSEICGYPVSLGFMNKMQINNLSSFPTQISNSLTQSLRKRYHSLPLPASVKSLVRFLYYRVYRKII